MPLLINFNILYFKFVIFYDFSSKTLTKLSFFCRNYEKYNKIVIKFKKIVVFFLILYCRMIQAVLYYE